MRRHLTRSPRHDHAVTEYGSILDGQSLSGPITTRISMHTIAMDAQIVPLPATSLIGRDDELGRLTTLLSRPDVRLVTLLGPGGVGKTRLALQIVHDIDPCVVGPVRVAFLANISDPLEVLPAIARAIGIPGVADTPILDAIVTRIGTAPLLLILDNVEQVAAGLTFLSKLIARCPKLTILVTSRVMLRLSAEHVFTVDPLPTRSAGYDELAPATALFVDRARLVHPDLELTDENIRAIDAICHKVDGLPLAIELAAARTRFLSPTAMRDRLTERLAMLVGGPRDVPERHRTLRATLAWSHDLLSTEERILFRRLGVATNGLPYDAVGPICNASGDLGNRVEEVLDSLVDHSLVRIDDTPETGPRVRLLHTIREFAGEQLELSGEREAIERAHALWYARMVIDTPNTTWGTGRPELRNWTLRHLPDRATFITVLKRLMDWGEHALALKMTAQLVSFWNEIGQYRDALEWSERVLPFAPDMPPAIQANIYFKAAMVLHMADRMDETLDLATRSLTIYEQIGDPKSIANLQNMIGNLQWQLGNHAEGERYHRMAIATTVASASHAGTAMFSAQLADRLVENGKYEEAERLLDEAEPIIARERPEAIPLLMGSKAILYLHTDRLPEAASSMQNALSSYREPPHRRPDLLSQLLLYAADLAARSRIGDKGTIVAAAAFRIVDDIGLGITKGLFDEVDRIKASLQDLIGDQQFETLWAQGLAMSTTDAILIATETCEHVLSGTSTVRETAITHDDDLTPREREVLRLLVEGKSNADIADELFISQRTVTTHLTRLYAKLDVSSRTAAISAAIRMGIAVPTYDLRSGPT
jgi:predicted ATPase/DNA-binding CsgD family transcriptional regulator